MRGCLWRFDEITIQLCCGEAVTLVRLDLGQQERRFVAGAGMEELSDDFCDAVAIARVQSGFELPPCRRSLKRLVRIASLRRQLAYHLLRGGFQPELGAIASRPLQKRVFVARQNTLQERQHLVIFVGFEAFRARVTARESARSVGK